MFRSRCSTPSSSSSSSSELESKSSSLSLSSESEKVIEFNFWEIYLEIKFHKNIH